MIYFCKLIRLTKMRQIMVKCKENLKNSSVCNIVAFLCFSVYAVDRCAASYSVLKIQDKTKCCIIECPFLKFLTRS